MYYCSKCGHNHRWDSKIGKKHASLKNIKSQLKIKTLSNSRLLGRQLGYKFAQEYSKNTGPVYLFGIRLHHYLLYFVSYFFDDEFLKGFFEGAGLEDLPDLLDDYAKFVPNRFEQLKLRLLANNIRKKQGKINNTTGEKK